MFKITVFENGKGVAGREWKLYDPKSQTKLLKMQNLNPINFFQTNGVTRGSFKENF